LPLFCRVYFIGVHFISITASINSRFFESAPDNGIDCEKPINFFEGSKRQNGGFPIKVILNLQISEFKN